MGEEAINLKVPHNNFIFRTSWLYALIGHNFPNTILKLAKTHDKLLMESTQTGAPTSAEYLAEVTALVLYRYLGGDLNHRGHYNVTASGETTWLEFSRYILTKAISLGLKFKLSPENIIPKTIKSPSSQNTAFRPLNSKLSTEKITKDFGLYPPHWTYGIDLFLEKYVSLKKQMEEP
jgi:dTDP-4-dehydrorhamnose reductase